MSDYGEHFEDLPPDAIAEDHDFEELAPVDESFDFSDRAEARHITMETLEEQLIESSMLRHRLQDALSIVEDAFEAMHGGYLVKSAFVYGFVRTDEIGVYDVWVRNIDPRPDAAVPTILWKKRKNQWRAPTEIPLRESFALEIGPKWQVVGGGDDDVNGYYLLQVVKNHA